ncbi:beta-2 adrenergic receptor-like [Amphiura filiformis]|uniref:beta-2 adrenergic receptor-like n=1 Tax=Amphiura filiformis TaxID=82378 RepID=UPI003B21775F
MNQEIMDNVTVVPAIAEQPEDTLHPVIFFLMWFNVLLTGGFNLITIIAYLSSKEIRNNPGNIYILNLAFADAKVGLISLPFFNLWWHYGIWTYGEILCKFWIVVDYTAVTQSMVAIIIISWDRLWMVSQINTYMKNQTTRLAILLIVSTWTLWYVYYICIVAFGEQAAPEYHIDYSNDCDLHINYLLNYTIYEIVALYLVPLLIIACINLRIYVLVRRRLAAGRSEIALKNRKAAITLAILVAAYFICWTPYHIVLLMETIQEGSVPYPVVAFVEYLLWLNSTVNPFVYVCTNPLFRKQLRKMFCCRRMSWHKSSYWNESPERSTQKSQSGSSQLGSQTNKQIIASSEM